MIVSNRKQGYLAQDGPAGKDLDWPKVMEAQKKLVLSSIETPDGGRCVDLFRTPDGSFGFEEYRRDAEDSAVEGLSGGRTGLLKN